MKNYLSLKKYFSPANYLFWLKRIYKIIRLTLLEYKKFKPVSLRFIWKPRAQLSSNFDFAITNDWNVFGYQVNLKSLEWNKDYRADFVYPNIRADKIKIEKWFNKKIDVKFPWELSRFYFAVTMGQKYLLSQDEKFYENYRHLVLDWIEKNKFPYGVNWVSPMEAAIRAINLIVAANFFFDKIINDMYFQKQLSSLLLKHAYFLITFPETYDKGLTTNHTTAGFTGLLFLGLTLIEHKNSNLWIRTAKEGLEKCIKDQVYHDGSNFEASIPYHRLVSEMFLFCSLIAKSNNIEFSKQYYVALFKMVEFIAAYIDEGGNAPQIGDNDSGRVLIFDAISSNNQYLKEANHSYLVDIGEQIFDYCFPSQCKKRENDFINYLPDIDKINISVFDIKPRQTDKSIEFRDGGFYFLKNKNLFLTLACCPLGQRGKGGHNHLDFGSFTLSIKGKMLIVDPGTATYSADRLLRDKFRSYTYHNTLFSEVDYKTDLSEFGYWSIGDYYKGKVLCFDEDKISLEIKYVNDKAIRRRTFELNTNEVLIKELYSGDFFSRINFCQDINLQIKAEGIVDSDDFTIEVTNANKLVIYDYLYSPNYYSTIKSSYIQTEAVDSLEILIKLKTC